MQALFVAHPGHELRLHRWLEVAQPVVHVLTDGSGSAGHSRIPSTRHVLDETGARAGSVLAPFTDHEIYDAILNCDPSKLAAVTELLAAEFASASSVVCDSWEGYNPAHDLCRIVAELATARASVLAGRVIPLYEYAVVGRFEVRDTPGEIVVPLDEKATERKLAAAYAYAELRSDVDEMLRNADPDQLRVEVLRPATAPRREDTPFYEQRGEQQVAAGRYPFVLRHREHVAPFIDALTRVVRNAPLPSPEPSAQLTAQA